MSKRKDENVFDNPYSGKILIYILEHGRIKKSDLLSINKNNDTITDSLNFLLEKNAILIEKEDGRYKINWITLTDTGFKFAMKFKELQNIQEGIGAENPDLGTLEKVHESIKKES